MFERLNKIKVLNYTEEGIKNMLFYLKCPLQFYYIFSMIVIRRVAIQLRIYIMHRADVCANRKKEKLNKPRDFPLLSIKQKPQFSVFHIHSVRDTRSLSCINYQPFFNARPTLASTARSQKTRCKTIRESVQKLERAGEIFQPKIKQRRNIAAAAGNCAVKK